MPQNIDSSILTQSVPIYFSVSLFDVHIVQFVPLAAHWDCELPVPDEELKLR